jgi:hypothetical protein
MMMCPPIVSFIALSIEFGTRACLDSCLAV